MSVLAKSYPDIIFTLQSQCTLRNKYYEFVIYNGDDEMMSDFLEVADINPFPNPVTTAPLSRVLRTVESVSTEEIEGSDFFNHLLSHRGAINRGFGLIMHRERTDSAFIAANIPDRFRGTQEEDLLDTLEFLRPHAQNAFRLYLELDRRRLEASPAEAFWLDRIPTAALIVNENGHIHLMNSRAEDLLSAHPSLFVSRGSQLTSRSSRQRIELEGLIGQAARSGGVPGPVVLRHLSGHSSVVFAFPILQDRDRPPVIRPFATSDVRMLVTILESSDTPPSHDDLVRQLLNLTARETAVAMELARGKSLREAAEDLSISYHTARNHLASATAKSNLRSQADLIRIITMTLSRISA